MIYHGDCLTVLRTQFADESVQCCVTSPPYWGLRDYGCEGQLGLEATPELYVAKMVEVFREVKRVLKADGTLWLNLGDSYTGAANNGGEKGNLQGTQNATGRQLAVKGGHGLKPKDLVGIPWSVAKALQSPYYTGQIAREIDRVWLAAIIDGEGSICGFTHERKDDQTIRTGIHITITNTNMDLLDNAFRIWPTSKQDHNLHGEGHFGSADTYRWIAHNVDNKSNLLRELYPYFIAKKKQALLAWNFLEMSKEAKRLARTVEAEDVKGRRAWIVNAISKLNHFQSIDIPSWCKEPPTLFEPGWYLRSDIIWAKPNPMPESVTDRPTKSHEYLFLLTKSERYYYDAEAIREDGPTYIRKASGYVGFDATHTGNNQKGGFADKDTITEGRNKRTVWTIATQPYSEAHFATFPPKLIEPCILAGCPSGGLVLDPFAGSGTTIQVAQQLGRQGVGIELNPAYIALADTRTAQTGLQL